MTSPCHINWKTREIQWQCASYNREGVRIALYIHHMWRSYSLILNSKATILQWWTLANKSYVFFLKRKVVPLEKVHNEPSKHYSIKLGSCLFWEGGVRTWKKHKSKRIIFEILMKKKILCLFFLEMVLNRASSFLTMVIVFITSQSQNFFDH